MQTDNQDFLQLKNIPSAEYIQKFIIQGQRLQSKVLCDKIGRVLGWATHIFQLKPNPKPQSIKTTFNTHAIAATLR